QAAGVEVDLMAVGHEAPRQGRDVHLAAAAGRQDALVAECDVHDITTRPVRIGLPCPWACGPVPAARGERYAASRRKKQAPFRYDTHDASAREDGTTEVVVRPRRRVWSR